VLTGLVAGLLAQGMETVCAAFAGAYLHGLAGDLAAGRYGQRGVLASDILEQVPQAIHLTEG
jgi:NAD(P)H-hydrate epimerase